MEIPHKNEAIYRFTPRLKEDQSLDSVLVKQNPLTFEIANKTIVFNQGEIVTPSQVLSQQGYWIKTNQNDRPIIKNKNTKQNQQKSKSNSFFQWLRVFLATIFR